MGNWGKEHETVKRHGPGIWQYHDVVIVSFRGHDLVVRQAIWDAGIIRKNLKVFDLEGNVVEHFWVDYPNEQGQKQIVVDTIENDLPVSITSVNCDIILPSRYNSREENLTEFRLFRHILTWNSTGDRLKSIDSFDGQKENPLVPYRSIQYRYSDDGVLIEKRRN